MNYVFGWCKVQLARSGLLARYILLFSQRLQGEWLELDLFCAEVEQSEEVAIFFCVSSESYVLLPTQYNNSQLNFRALNYFKVL